ncbi:MAG: type VI secretion system ImpA family N-terminal domain-containing protein [Desulfobacterales bacterium]|nr:type VI secretion system ImpA family N-terminal domain-containing protein [Desulfobacterales bacterium]
MDKTLLLKSFTVQENPGLTLTDPRFNELTTHIQSGDFNEVAILAETIISEEVYDIRVICYFLFGIFLEHGAAGIPEIFQSLIKILDENWDAVGPVKNKEKQFANSLIWLSKQLSRKIDYEEKKESPEWVRWQQTTDTEMVQAAIDLSETLQKKLSEKLEDQASSLVDGISNLRSWLGSLLRLIYKPEPEPEPEPESEQVDPETAQEPEPAAPVKASGPQPSIQVDPGNYHMARLQKKIAAFESLISSEKYEQASLVAFDIDHIIENFDPRLYLPEIFADFSLLYSMNIKEILRSKKYTNSSEWKALKELYKVDIDRFTDMDLDLDFSNIQTDDGGGSGESGYNDDYDNYDD